MQEDRRSSVSVWPANPETDTLELWPLVKAYLTEMREMGSEIEPTDRSVNFMVDLAFNLCESTSGYGLVAVNDQMDMVGFTIAGEIVLPYDHDMGRVACGYGTYVDPMYRGGGVSDELRLHLRNWLRRVGFNTIVGAAHDKNSVGLKSALKTSRATQTIIRVDLGDQE